jgi:hypothetical protein
VTADGLKLRVGEDGRPYEMRDVDESRGVEDFTHSGDQDMTEDTTVTIWRCTFCANEWDAQDGARPAELCPFQHANPTGWYRTGHQIDAITISVPDDPSGLWESKP